MHVRSAFDGLVRRRAGVTVLTLAGTAMATADDSQAWCAKVESLAQRARIITMDEGVRGLSREDHAVDNSVVLTVDDGTAAFADIVVPFLVRLHLPLTMYLTTQLVEDQETVGSAASPMSWSGVRDALDTGLLTIGSRGHTGVTLGRATRDAASTEIRRSIELIAARTGRTPMHFAYPGAVRGSRAAQQIVREHFHSAAVGAGRTNAVGGTDLYRLVRTAIVGGARGSAAGAGALDAPRR